ncbi:MAG: hypothetical protein KME23_17630 [Goleter apudmare HA4340-LM2]|jgi:hypothetical protein|nr:hypothetical protein [Goleter apudmare HA4340-LM2]MBW4644782.1 hypothetical protein [Goleter apudmare HA4340-LM2]
MNKQTLDRLSTFLGLVAGGASLLSGSGLIDTHLAGAVGGVATAILGYLVQRPAIPDSNI